MILLCGKTCSGKDTIQKELVKTGMNAVVSYTTRPPRAGEKDGVAYHFISEEDFLEKKEKGFFAETASYNVATNAIWYYGSAIEDLTENKVMIVNPCSLRQLKKFKNLNSVAFYLMADKKTILDRLKMRGDCQSEARRRLDEDDKDFVDIDNIVDFAFRNDGIILKPEILAGMILYTYRKLIKES